MNFWMSHFFYKWLGGFVSGTPGCPSGADHGVVYGATYPVAYDYDDFGRMVALHTWRDENGAPDTTQWLYDPATGLLLQKLYADNKGPSYTYDPSGNLTHIDYSDATTPSVLFTYDRMGRQTTAIVDGVVTNLYAYNTLGQLLTETTIVAQASLLASTSTLTRTYDLFGRPTGHSLGAPASSPAEHAVTYTYDSYGRFSTLTTHNSSLLTVPSSLLTTYSYLPGTDLIQSLTYNGTGHAWTRTYEPQRNLKTPWQIADGEARGVRIALEFKVADGRGLRADVAGEERRHGEKFRSR